MLTKIDLGWPNVEIGRKMANDQLLFLALTDMITSVILKETNTFNNDLRDQ